jgi:hypothetical protein
MRLDPWLGFGLGWREVWEERSGVRIASAGLDLARLQAGLDFRFGSSFALSPVIGADWSVQVWNDAPALGGASSGTARINALIFTGLLGRLQAFGP